MTNPNDPAFSTMVINKGQKFEDYDRVPVGLTKREYFAAMAMQGKLSNNDFINGIDEKGIEITVKFAVYHADALIAELNKDSKR